ncbi:glycoside hydrolase family 97 catalytic domain-containing protein [Flammeovirga yaeyamensis]|uniref:Glycoside hydrolase family 97 catalytic domain-containing protein n=1 Tax=Flammeovirga yaeyamensis TaxID=367791 RepID=A0AAX1NFY1_9BACT|nr:glycoside hydrolase family 97 protein [Flammeovirga yaeyamensis]MBB3696754.1 alpha-glucosidase [Flammeovirga yaeyamensis]NMF33422.1 glycoside hydrolase family 97 protein [Flammeovirga yaeyamensis]QWG05303.1 glycoside hydrolase family 97 catalytic domain-containing protein [Flammeovirga yaeyamensis]
MKRITSLALLCLFFGCQSKKTTTVSSPNGEHQIAFELNKNGQIFYQISSGEQKIIDLSALGFELKSRSLKQGFQLLKSETTSHASQWKTVWGEEEMIDDIYNEITLEFRQRKSNILVNIIARAFDDGVAFRYEFPEQKNLLDFVIMDELTEFNFAGDYKAWWNFADYDNYEKVYYSSSISEIGDSLKFERRVGKEERANMCNTPLTVEVNDDLVVSIHEAELVDYAGMTLLNTLENETLKANLTPWRNGDLVRTAAPMKTPWRTVQIGHNAGDLVESRMIMNLNPPCAIEDTDWIKTSKYIGIWWELHTGRTSWAEKVQFGKPLPPTRPHGATTENAKYHIDFAAKHGFEDVLIEGWIKGWDNMGDNWTGYGIFDWETPADDFDFEEVLRYGKEKGVRMMAYHETISDIDHYEPEMDRLYAEARNRGIDAIKVGYTGDVNFNTTVPNSYAQHHHGQYMVRHYRKMIQTAAKNKIRIIHHEPIKYTGEQRTYPNIMAREGARGQEYNAWSEGNSPEHGVVLPFTRLLGGPMDYTLGIFEVKLPQREWAKFEIRVRSTVMKQVAYFVTMYSPIPMAADLPRNYEKNMEAFQFIKDVPTNWSESKVLNAKIGDYFTIARKERGTENWYLGSITDENPRTFSIDLDFLHPDKTYQATIYADGKDAHWESNPYPVEVTKINVTAKDKLSIQLAAGGGQAIAFKALD